MILAGADHHVPHAGPPGDALTIRRHPGRPAVLLGPVPHASLPGRWPCGSACMPFRFSAAPETAFVSWVGLRGCGVHHAGDLVPIHVGGLAERLASIFNAAFIIVLGVALAAGLDHQSAGAAARPRRAQRASARSRRSSWNCRGSAQSRAARLPRGRQTVPVARGERVPRWARPSLVIRDGPAPCGSTSMPEASAVAGDYVYHLHARTRYPRLLDRLFASPAPDVEVDDADFFGAFHHRSLSARPTELQAAYGFDLTRGRGRR